MSIPEFDRSRAGWWALGAAVAAALAFVVYSFVGTVVFGIFLYYATRPVYRRIRRRVGNPTLAAGVSLIALAAPALALVGYAAVLVATQAQQFVGEFDVIEFDQIPGIDRETLAALSDPQTLLALDWTQYVSTDTLSSLVESLSSAAGAAAVFGIGLLHLFVMFVIAFYLLRDGARLRRWIAGFGDERGVMQAYLTAVDRDYKNIFFGNILNAAFTGTIGVVAYTVLNAFAPSAAAIPAAALVGLLAGVASLVPVVGMKLVYVPVAVFMTLRAVAAGGTETLWFVGVFAVVSFVVVDTVPDLVLRPYVSGRSLHVGSVMLAYTLGPLLFGWYGIFLLPMVLVVAVQFARIVVPELVSGREIRPYGVDPAALDQLPEPAYDPDEVDPRRAGAETVTESPRRGDGAPGPGDDPTTDGGHAAYDETDTDGDERPHDEPTHHQTTDHPSGESTQNETADDKSAQNETADDESTRDETDDEQTQNETADDDTEPMDDERDPFEYPKRD